MTCKKIDSLMCESETECIIKEEVVEFVGADEVFGSLFDVSVAVSGNQFRTDGGIDYVKEASAYG